MPLTFPLFLWEGGGACHAKVARGGNCRHLACFCQAQRRCARTCAASSRTRAPRAANLRTRLAPLPANLPPPPFFLAPLAAEHGDDGLEIAAKVRRSVMTCRGSVLPLGTRTPWSVTAWKARKIHSALKARAIHSCPKRRSVCSCCSCCSSLSGALCVSSSSGGVILAVHREAIARSASRCCGSECSVCANCDRHTTDSSTTLRRTAGSLPFARSLSLSVSLPLHRRPSACAQEAVSLRVWCISGAPRGGAAAAMGKVCSLRISVCWLRVSSCSFRVSFAFAFAFATTFRSHALPWSAPSAPSASAGPASLCDRALPDVRR